jgi:ABC-type multidrug transport system ATPase subunit
LGQFQKLVGFVPQEDVMIRELSVRDNIEFSARYRLPKELTPDEINRKVNVCINELGIPHVQHSPIGDERTRGVSGGQRKRVNIGIELVADPKVLFLDEPTSGLDSTTATSLCSTLKKIASIRQMTIAAVIHQPSLSSFLEFDDLLLLGKGGRVIYHGPVKESEAYFKSIGFPLPVQCNPADFYLDVTQGAIPRKDHPEFEWPDLFDFWEEHCSTKQNQTRMSKSFNSERASESVKNNQLVLKKALSQKKLTEQPEYVWKMALSMVVEGYYTVYDFFVEQYNDVSAYIKSFYEKDPIRETPSGWYQFYLCYIRASKQCFGGFSSFILECILHLLCGAVIAVSAGRLSFVGPLPDTTCILTPAALQSDCALPLEGNYPQTGNFMCFGVLFAAVATASGIFGNEQVNFWRETSSGLQPIPYFFGKWFAYIPRIICSAFFFWFAFSIKFNNTGAPKDLFEIILFLYWFGYSIGFFVSQIVNIRDAALTGVLFALIFAVGFSGVNPNMNEVRDKGAAGGFWSLSGPRWAIEAFYIASVKNYKSVPNGAYDGAPYEDVSDSLSAIGYNVNNFAYDIGGLFWTGLGWGLFALLLMVVFRKYRPS